MLASQEPSAGVCVFGVGGWLEMLDCPVPRHMGIIASHWLKEHG
jgi:hypothetical protein